MQVNLLVTEMCDFSREPFEHLWRYASGEVVHRCVYLRLETKNTKSSEETLDLALILTKSHTI